MTDRDYAELELGFHRWSVESYSVDVRYSPPGDSNEINFQALTNLPLDLSNLADPTLETTEYGKRLTETVFANDDLRRAFDDARVRADENQFAIRLRIFVSPTAPELHAVRWETLLDPRDPSGPLLAVGERVLLSRFVSAQRSLGILRGQQVRLRPRSDLKSLVLVANPRGLGSHEPGGRPDFKPVEVDDEVLRATDGLGGQPPVVVADQGQATFNNLIDHLDQGIDVLYLVCHGLIVEQVPWLFLEDEHGEVAEIPGEKLVGALQGLTLLPRLVVLASCQSAGTGLLKNDPGEEAFLRAIGPRLAEIGIPAVLAMQGNISIDTSTNFLKRFFEEVRRDGQLDRAMGVARRTVADKPDAWMPTLFLRLRTGRLWYEPGYGFERWPVLTRNVVTGKCTPILGPILHESMVGSASEISVRWAQDFGYPLARLDSDELHRVAQYVAVTQGSGTYPAQALQDHLRRRMVESHPGELADELSANPALSLSEMVKIVGAHQRVIESDNPYNILADLHFNLYINAGPTDLLAEALLAHDPPRAPVREVYRWNKDMTFPSYLATHPDYEPTAANPLIYHVFGHLDDEASIVLTEDDFFTVLQMRHSLEYMIPKAVTTPLVGRSLLFIGFELHDWSFRVLFRMLMSPENQEKRRGLPHAAVQVNPEDDRFSNPVRARKYLEEYFDTENITIFWGTAKEFIVELGKRRSEWERLNQPGVI